MFAKNSLCLHIPVAIPLGRYTLHGQLALPATATEVRVCVGRQTDRGAQEREAAECAKLDIALLKLETATPISSADLLRVIDWVRSKRLLQPLAISLMTAAADALAAVKAAHHRPSSVSGVFVMKPQRQPVRHLRLAYSA